MKYVTKGAAIFLFVGVVGNLGAPFVLFFLAPWEEIPIVLIGTIMSFFTASIFFGLHRIVHNFDKMKKERTL